MAPSWGTCSFWGVYTLEISWVKNKNSGWWLNQSIWKILVKLDHLPQGSGWKFPKWKFFFSSQNWGLFFHMNVSKNSGTPKSSILIGLSLINHPFWGYHHLRETTTLEFMLPRSLDRRSLDLRSSHKKCSPPRYFASPKKRVGHLKINGVSWFP